MCSAFGPLEEQRDLEQIPKFTFPLLSVNRFIKYATVNSGREGRICERPKMIGWSLSQAGAPEMGISEEGAASCCTELPSQITPSYVLGVYMKNE